MRRITGIFLMVIAMAFAMVTANPTAWENENWPQWRGPLATGVAPTGDPPIEWAADKNIKCRRQRDLPARQTAPASDLERLEAIS